MRVISGTNGFGGAISSEALTRTQGPADPTSSSPRVDHRRGYPVGDGSFARDVRGTQPQPERDLHFAMMANDAYASNAQGPTGTQSERELTQAGWTRLTPVGDQLVDAQGHRIPISPELLHDAKTGFDAAIYQNREGQYVLAYRGTDNWSPGQGGDATTNAGQGLGLSTAQYQQAQRLAEEATLVFGSGNVAITGHSLGGGLASAAMLAIGAPGVTFNAAGLSDNTLRNLGFASPNAVRSELAGSGQIRRYNVAGEVLTNLQQGTALPDAVGHELRVAPAAHGARDPITLHGGSGDGTSYVEALRENTAHTPRQGSPLQRTLEQAAESNLKILAATGTHVWGAATDSMTVVGQVAQEAREALRGEVAQGRVALGAGQVAGSVANGVADVGAVALHRGSDLAGDIVREHSTRVGSMLRNVGDSAGLAQPLGKLATAVENAGYRANQVMDDAGATASRWLDKAGDTAQQWLGKLGAGVERQLDRAAAGVQWAVDQAEAGARWLGDRVTDAGRWLARQLRLSN